jgi:hypothetical protein
MFQNNQVFQEKIYQKFQSQPVNDLRAEFYDEQKTTNNVKNNGGKKSNGKKKVSFKNNLKGGNADLLSKESSAVTPCSEKMDSQKTILVVRNGIYPSVTVNGVNGLNIKEALTRTAKKSEKSSQNYLQKISNL